MLTVTKSVLWRGRTGNDKTYFHPRATVLPAHAPTEAPALLMTLQEIRGSDYFLPVEFTSSADKGITWSRPEFIPGLGRDDIGDGVSDGVCDVVPDYHAVTGTVLAIGHNVYYKNGKLLDTLGDFEKDSSTKRLSRVIVYTTRDAAGKWEGARKRLHAPEFSNCSMFSCGCSQKVILPSGELIIPITFGFFGRRDRLVSSLRCAFDGKELLVQESGTRLELPIGRGLLEPSIVNYDGKFFMTIRAEDGHGHLSISEDGLHWGALSPWRWQDGTEVEMSSTQQHWLTLGGKLHLVYTRRNEENEKVVRWRAPVFIAEVAPDQRCLLRHTEQVALPLVGDGVNAPQEVPFSGNFHPLALSQTEAIITDGEMLPSQDFCGDTILARLRTTD